MRIVLNTSEANFPKWLRFFQYFRKKGMLTIWRVFFSEKRVIKLNKFRTEIELCPIQPKEKKYRTDPDKVWDNDRRMWYRPVGMGMGEWSIWRDGKMKRKYNFKKPNKPMSGPRLLTIEKDLHGKITRAY